MSLVTSGDICVFLGSQRIPEAIWKPILEGKNIERRCYSILSGSQVLFVLFFWPGLGFDESGSIFARSVHTFSAGKEEMIKIDVQRRVSKHCVCLFLFVCV